MWTNAAGDKDQKIAASFAAALKLRGANTPSADDQTQIDAVVAEDAIWHGTAQGRTDIAANWAGDGSSTTDIGTVYADGNHVVASLVRTGSNGKQTAVRQAMIFHLNEAGVATDMWSLPPESAVLQALTTGELPPAHPNVAIFRAAEEARARNIFNDEDMVAINRFLREDVRWNSAWGDGPTNRDQVVAQFHTFNDATGGTMNLALNEVFADETHAISLVRLQADRPDRPGKHMDVKEANVFHLDADGQTFEFWGLAENQSEITTFWSD
jgi:hypothetical protein